MDEKWKRHFLTIMFDGISVPCKECPISARLDPTPSQLVAPHSQAADYSRAYPTTVLCEQNSSMNATLAALRKFVPKRQRMYE